MVSRIVDCNIKPENLNQFRETLAKEILPRIKSQPGFVDVVESLDANTGHFVCTTLWNTREDVERYDHGLFQEVASRLVPLLQGEPSVHTMDVETSSAHQVSKGAAA